ncbi:uncharacterized protein LOC123710039 [Pieris brassicae]|uniref:Uncharacterized protein n=1 Tax=Pieris brassicae TaxID=7116 RepID=A0A9P0TA78_PIEBR|nr:uncharacterized protein LOC123710039 [Pieris brassicae]CAH4027367.1 unnamed protein product [Pieris brassicae]
MSDFESSDSEYETDLDVYSSGPELPFNPSMIEDLILSITDKFNFRVVMSDRRVKNAVLVTTGLSVAGALIGKYYGGKTGAVVGGAVGGVCGLGVVAVTMREIWQEIKGKLPELYEIVYDYLAGLGFDDYHRAIKFVLQHSGATTQLGMLILQITSDTLGKKILSSFTPA